MHKHKQRADSKSFLIEIQTIGIFYGELWDNYVISDFMPRLQQYIIINMKSHTV